MFQTFSVRLPTRHIHINNFSQQESEKLFDICSKRKVLHVSIDNTFYANCDLRYLDVLKLRQVQYIECVRICHNQRIRLLTPADLDDVRIVNEITECIFTIFECYTKGHILLYCDDDNDQSRTRESKETPSIPIPFVDNELRNRSDSTRSSPPQALFGTQHLFNTNTQNPFSTNSQNPYVARRHSFL